jgi:hypothetical protein
LKYAETKISAFSGGMWILHPLIFQHGICTDKELSQIGTVYLYKKLSIIAIGIIEDQKFCTKYYARDEAEQVVADIFLREPLAGRYCAGHGFGTHVRARFGRPQG